MRDPIMALAEWASRRTDWWKQQEADLQVVRQELEAARLELEAVRVDLEIRTMIAETKAKSAVTKAKAEIIDDLRTALEAHRG